jgi:hypothetical protein
VLLGLSAAKLCLKIVDRAKVTSSQESGTAVLSSPVAILASSPGYAQEISDTPWEVRLCCCNAGDYVEVAAGASHIFMCV